MQRDSDSKKYHGVAQTIQTIYKEEGLAGLFPNPLASFMWYFNSAFVSASSDIVLQRVFRLHPIHNRSLYGFGDFLWCMFGLCLRLPLSTCRRRLMTQGGVQSKMETIMPTNPAYLPYDGIVDCVTRVVSEEGVSALFRGFRMHAFYNFVLFSLYYATGSDLMDADM